MMTLNLPTGEEVVFDDDDRARVLSHNWVRRVRSDGSFEAKTNFRMNGRKRAIYLHRLICDATDDQKVKARDGNRLNCCRENLVVIDRLPKKPCAHCGGDIKSRSNILNRYCSRSCAGTANNLGRDRHLAKRGRPLEKPCATCGAATKNLRFCSRTCKAALRSPEEKRRIKIEAWQRYKAKKVNQTPPDVDVEALRTIYLNCPEGHEVDHIIPISKGGLHHPDNLQYLPKSENRRKSNKLMSPWRSDYAVGCNPAEAG